MEGVSTALEFPRLTREDLKDITMGAFHLKQANSYVNERMDEDGNYGVWVSTQEKNLLLACIQSNHSNRKQYHVVIRYNSTTVEEWCCECPNGNNNIGCCSHVCSILWFLRLA